MPPRLREGVTFSAKSDKKMPKTDTLGDAITTILTTNLENTLDNQS